MNSPALELTVAISEKTSAQSWWPLTPSPATFTRAVTAALLVHCLNPHTEVICWGPPTSVYLYLCDSLSVSQTTLGSSLGLFAECPFGSSFIEIQQSGQIYERLIFLLVRFSTSIRRKRQQLFSMTDILHLDIILDVYVCLRAVLYPFLHVKPIAFFLMLFLLLLFIQRGKMCIACAWFIN